jgi:hypothetical protein
MPLTKNLQAFALAIPWTSWPQTFKDAILLVANRGLKYSQTDALCIVQDNHEDRLAEAPRMMGVYANAALNISTNHDRDSDQGLFSSRNIEVFRPLTWRSDTKDGSSYWMLYGDGNVMDDVFRTPLNRRAWVAQERFLAARVVTAIKPDGRWTYKRC